jgi:hypothetical protein
MEWPTSSEEKSDNHPLPEKRRIREEESFAAPDTGVFLLDGARQRNSES